jgi:hypothetical protein
MLNIIEETVLDILEDSTIETRKTIAGVSCNVSLEKPGIKTLEEINSIKKKFKEKGLPVLSVIPKEIIKKTMKGLDFFTFKNFADDGKTVPADVEGLVESTNKKGGSIAKAIVFMTYIFCATVYAFYFISFATALEHTFWYRIPIGIYGGVSLLIGLFYVFGGDSEDHKNIFLNLSNEAKF